jgi:hypothetical protein
LACGISGAIQHIAGCAVIGDLHQVGPALRAARRAR